MKSYKLTAWMGVVIMTMLIFISAPAHAQSATTMVDYYQFIYYSVSNLYHALDAGNNAPWLGIGPSFDSTAYIPIVSGRTPTSTNQLKNLNADLLDGHHWSEIDVNFVSNTKWANVTLTGQGSFNQSLIVDPDTDRQPHFNSTSAPFHVENSNMTNNLVTNLNADALDGHHWNEISNSPDPTFNSITVNNGSSYLNNLHAGPGTSYISGNSQFTGLATFNGGLTVSSGNTTLGALTISGMATHNGNADFNGFATFDGPTTVTGNTSGADGGISPFCVRPASSGAIGSGVTIAGHYMTGGLDWSFFSTGPGGSLGAGKFGIWRNKIQGSASSDQGEYVYYSTKSGNHLLKRTYVRTYVNGGELLDTQSGPAYGSEYEQQIILDPVTNNGTIYCADMVNATGWINGGARHYGRFKANDASYWGETYNSNGVTPPSNTEGDVYYDKYSHKLRVCTNNGWVDLN